MRPENALNELCILAVDDEDVNLLILRRTLERAGYTRVHTANNPSCVPALFVQTEPDLVVLDLHMPGPTTLEAIPRFIQAAPGCVVLVLTMEKEPTMAREALSAGAHYLDPSVGAALAKTLEASGFEPASLAGSSLRLRAEGCPGRSDRRGNPRG